MTGSQAASPSTSSHHTNHTDLVPSTALDNDRPLADSPDDGPSVIQNDAEQEEYPEGGYGWFVLAGSFVMAFWTIGVALCYGIFEEYFLDSQYFPNTSAQNLAWMGSVGMFSTWVVAPVIVVLNAHLGIRRVLWIGVFLTTSGLVCSSFIISSWQLYFTLSIPMGLGGCILYFTSTTVMLQYFYKRRALATGIASAGSSIGGTVLSPLMRYMMTELGYPSTARILGGMLFISVGIASCFIKPLAPLSGPNPTSDTESANRTDNKEEDGFTTSRPPIIVSRPEPKINLDFSVFKSLDYALLFVATFRACIHVPAYRHSLLCDLNWPHVDSVRVIGQPFYGHHHCFKNWIGLLG
ncbi:hypothetical protein EMPS_10743 [Entomortierella parvispora]|uniref:Major facilitator superfamily (MFS) profile domain-containing protein n=1 Tax=Entomortierella parvispora TaxID=205924 RepID=A0A9P3M1H1_9FUNG|nr:hypothetical protein EMPS_10743 [Entomortierella parvispora]